MIAIIDTIADHSVDKVYHARRADWAMAQREIAYNKIRDAITYGKFRPGERLVEKRLCALFEIGRTPLREALSQLQIEGYLDFEPNKGVTIRSVSPSDLKDIYGVLSVLEGYATELATYNIKADDERQLQHIQSDLNRAFHERDFKGWMDTNGLFHEYLARLSGNAHLHKLIVRERGRIYRYRLISTAIPDSLPAYFQSHSRMLDAISKGEGKRAGTVMQEHIKEVCQVILDFMNRIPGL